MSAEGPSPGLPAIAKRPAPTCPGAGRSSLYVASGRRLTRHEFGDLDTDGREHRNAETVRRWVRRGDHANSRCHNLTGIELLTASVRWNDLSM